MSRTKFRIHTILGHSYLFAFSMFLVGFLLDSIFPLQPLFVFSQYLGFGALILGTFLIMWAQHTSDKTKKVRLHEPVDQEALERSFAKGPYKYVRVPTHIGIFLVFFGFGFMINSFFVPVTAVIAFFVNKYFFATKEEHILQERYGEPYKAYQHRVKF